MEAESTLLLNRTDVQKLLSLTECVAAVERVFRLAGRRKDSVVGNSWRKNAERWSSREDCMPERREKLHRRQTKHELSAELCPFWAANNPGRRSFCTTPTTVDCSRFSTQLKSHLSALRLRLPLQQNTSRGKILQSRRSAVVASKAMLKFARFL